MKNVFPIIKTLCFGLAAFILVIFLFFNLITAQKVGPMYAHLVNGESEATVDFFKKAKSLYEFQKIFPEIEQTFILLEDKVYAEDRQRKEQISYLEGILFTNPQSRDVLQTLAMLYKKEGEIEMSQEYLMRAKEVDPEIE